ncbi:efflux RND transporter permease subunit [Chryseobacterium daeguense]|uniref:efflux RND transporter permease subunit n=1 Tax=Chryseobacterium daeguense TaxID=412438 RepID=UPI000412C583|nr:efflux RND transporter permease subunit [Chryseobacterium daeguense]
MSITSLSIRKPLLLAVIFTILGYFGISSYLNLNYDLLPKFEIPEVTVSTLYPGASASEVESAVTKKLEDAFSSIENLDQIKSTSQEGVSIISLAFKSDTDVNQAEQDLQKKVDATLNQLPKTAERPQVNRVNMQATPVIKAGVTANMEPTKLYDLLDNQLKPILNNIKGVGQTDLIGGNEREIHININQEKLTAYGLSADLVTQTIRKANISVPAGSLENDNSRISIRYDANVKSLDELRNLAIVENPKTGAIYLKNIAEVADAPKKITSINRINGIPSIGLEISKQTDANAVKLSEEIKKRFSELESQYQSQNLKFDISIDQSEYTVSSADAVMYDLVLAVVIVGFVMLFFLHSFRSLFFVLVALPASIIPTFTMLYLLGYSLNIMTLMGLSLVVGILVDDSIVVLENIYRKLEEGLDKEKASIEGRNEIGFTALSITLVDVVVFLPLALSGGMIGGLLKEFSLVVVFSTLMSLFVSFTITPLLASRFAKLEQLKNNTAWGKIALGFEKFIGKIKDNYGKWLRIVLNKKRWFLLFTTLLISGSVALILIGLIGTEFIPETDQNTLVINMELESTSPISKTNRLVQESEKILLRQPEIVKVFSSIGFMGGNISGSESNSNLAEITLSLVDKKHRNFTTEEFGSQIQKKLASEIAGVKFTTASSSITGGTDSAPIEIAIKGTDADAVRKAAESYQKIISKINGIKYAKLSVKNQKPEIDVKIDRRKMSLIGLDAEKVGEILENSFNGNNQSLFKQNNTEYDINIRLDPFNRSDILNLKKLPFVNSNGQTILLEQFANVSEKLGETNLQRIDRLNAITVQADVFDRPVGTVSSEIKEKAKSIQLPAGIFVEYLGETQNQDNAFDSLIFALITAFVLVYLIMVALYESAVYPFVVLFSIPVALIGALLALALSEETINIFTIIGLIMLLGLVSKNAILIVDFTNTLKSQGYSTKEALILAGKERLRPILMTTFSMIFGMLPIALATGAASEMKNGIAWVIIGGLTSSMILTVFVVPCIYLIVDNVMRMVKKIKNFKLAKK